MCLQPVTTYDGFIGLHFQHHHVCAKAFALAVALQVRNHAIGCDMFPIS
jgi:hypothetical protein